MQPLPQDVAHLGCLHGKWPTTLESPILLLFHYTIHTFPILHAPIKFLTVLEKRQALTQFQIVLAPGAPSNKQALVINPSTPAPKVPLKEALMFWHTLP